MLQAMDQPSESHSAVEAAAPLTPSRRATLAVLGVIVLVSGALRLWNLRISPPGLNQDEAENAWNANTLRKTGKDQVGKRWPIFYTRTTGANRSPLSLYYLIPFQVLGGHNIWTTRLSSAVAGIATLLLIYYVGARLLGRLGALTAAGLTALNPWHIQQSRWGHEGALSAILVVLPVALWLWANLPIDGSAERRPRPLPALLAGVVTGICCYGYPAVRVFLPVFVLGVLAVTWCRWWAALKTRRGALAIAAFVAGGAATFAPLAWKHLAAPREIAKRSRNILTWEETDTAVAKVEKVLGRYVRHFGPEFLFIRGDHCPIQSPPGGGQFHWYALPLMLLGLAAGARAFLRSPAARVILVWVLVYPVGDSLWRHAGLHAMRSLPGLGGLVLLEALGVVAAAAWLWRRRRGAVRAVAYLSAMAVVAVNLRYLPIFFGQYNRIPLVYHAYHTDLLEAVTASRSEIERADVVFVTTWQMNQPYLIMLVALDYDPQQWFRERKVVQPGEFDLYMQVGKMHFMYDPYWRGAVESLRRDGRSERALFFLRPKEYEELRARLELSEPIRRVRNPAGWEVLYVCEALL
jgi:hypothetical protein